MITQTFIENNPVMNDPRSYSTHEDFELGYEDDKPTEKYPLDDWEDEEEGQVVSGRSWLPINTDSRPVAKQGGGGAKRGEPHQRELRRVGPVRVEPLQTRCQEVKPQRTRP
jgi:hypothetical protein